MFNAQSPRLTDVGYIRDLLDRHGFHFSKKLGQNFLINPSVCPRMAQACGAAEGSGVLEIGPGIGVLTRELALRAERVVSIELDDRLPPVLAETLAGQDNVSFVWGDCMKLDLPAIIAEKFGDMPVSVCANLPYYITSPIVMMLLESRLPVENITVMVQKEAAQRLCATPGTREAGAVTLAVQYYAEAETLFGVSRGSFMPAPNVDSAVIRLAVGKAKALLEEIGYDGAELPFHYPRHVTRAYLPTPERVYAELSRQLTAAGLNIKPVPVEWSDDYVQSVQRSGDRALHLFGISGTYDDPDNFVGSLFGSYTEEFAYDDAQLLSKIDRARTLESGPEQTEAYTAISDRISTRVPAVPLAFPISALAFSPRVAAYPTSPLLNEVFNRIELREQ